MTETKLLSDELLREVQEAARTQNRQPSEVVEDAVRRYLGERKWEALVLRGERRAAELGLKEDDIPRLIQEVREEKRARGR
jgi:predicted transcriptional regulator